MYIGISIRGQRKAIRFPRLYLIFNMIVEVFLSLQSANFLETILCVELHSYQ